MFSVHQHWDPLKVCAVGRSYPPEFYSYIKNSKVRNVFEKIAEETEEDYQKLISKLEKFDVEVVRTDIADNLGVYIEETNRIPPPPMVPRDFTAMVGNEFFMPSESYGEDIDPEILLKELTDFTLSESYQKLLNSPQLTEYLFDVFLPGRPVKVTPSSVVRLKAAIKSGKQMRSILSTIGGENLTELLIQSKTNTIGSNNKFPNFKKFYAFESIRKRITAAGNSIRYDQYINTATMTRVGRDLYHSLGNIVNLITREKCESRWENLFPNYRNHTLTIPGHGDSAYCPVKPGLIVSIKDPKFYKDTFPGWEVVHLPGQSWDMVRPHLQTKKKHTSRYWVPGEENNDAFHDYVTDWYDHWVTYVEETVFDVNMLVIDEKNVICNNENDQVFEAFERHGITPHVVNFRHRYFWDGGLHCITSDLHREGTQQDYFPDRELGYDYSIST